MIPFDFVGSDSTQRYGAPTQRLIAVRIVAPRLRTEDEDMTIVGFGNVIPRCQKARIADPAQHSAQLSATIKCLLICVQKISRKLSSIFPFCDPEHGSRQMQKSSGATQEVTAPIPRLHVAKCLRMIECPAQEEK